MIGAQAGSGGTGAEELVTGGRLQVLEELDVFACPDPREPPHAFPSSVAADGAGHLFIAHAENHRIRQVEGCR